MMRTSESNVSLMQKTVQTEIIFSLYLGTLTSMLYEENFKDKICSYNEIYTVCHAQIFCIINSFEKIELN